MKAIAQSQRRFYLVETENASAVVVDMLNKSVSDEKSIASWGSMGARRWRAEEEGSKTSKMAVQLAQDELSEETTKSLIIKVSECGADTGPDGGFGAGNSCAGGDGGPKAKSDPKAVESFKQYFDIQNKNRKIKAEARRLRLEARNLPSMESERRPQLIEEAKLLDKQVDKTLPFNDSVMAELDDDQIIASYQEAQGFAGPEQRADFDAKYFRESRRMQGEDDDAYFRRSSERYLSTQDAEGGLSPDSLLGQENQKMAFSIGSRADIAKNSFNDVHGNGYEVEEELASVRLMAKTESNDQRLSESMESARSGPAEWTDKHMPDEIPQTERDPRLGLVKEHFDRVMTPENFDDLEFDDYTEKSQKVMMASHDHGSEVYNDMIGLDDADRAYVVQQERIAISQHFAEDGVLASVSATNFESTNASASDSAWVGSEIENERDPGRTEFYDKRQLQLMYEQVFSADDAIQQLKSEGVDVHGLQIVFSSGGDPVIKDRAGRSSGLYTPASGKINLVGFGGDSIEINTSEDGSWTVMETAGNTTTAMHEIGHALHHRSVIEKSGAKDRSRQAKHLVRLMDEVAGKSEKLIKSEISVGQLFHEEAGFVSENISRYARTEPVEFVAETFTLKKLNPKAWEKVKDSPVFRRTNLSKVDMTIEEFYEALGGP